MPLDDTPAWRRRRFVTSLGVACAVAACRSDASPPATPATSDRPRGSWYRFAEDPRIGVYTSSAWGFSTASYWIEGPQGVVVLDTQFLPSAARELLDAISTQTDKPVTTAVVLHANPDKFNGTRAMQDLGIRVVTSDAVARLIPDVHAKRTRAFGSRYAPDYPTELPCPEALPPGTDHLDAGGMTLRLHALGPGCSGAHLVAQLDDHLFVGDLVASGCHSWLELGLVRPWLERISEITAYKPTWVHPGRGPSGTATLLARQSEYLRTVEAIVRAEHEDLFSRGHEPDAAAQRDAMARARALVETTFPDLRFEVFLRIGIPAVWGQLG